MQLAVYTLVNAEVWLADIKQAAKNKIFSLSVALTEEVN